MRYKLRQWTDDGKMIEAIYDTANDARTCACGCGSEIPPKSRADRKYISEAHRKRHTRRKTARKDRACPCGCGKTVSKPRATYATPACRVRALRTRNASEALPEWRDK